VLLALECYPSFVSYFLHHIRYALSNDSRHRSLHKVLDLRLRALLVPLNLALARLITPSRPFVLSYSTYPSHHPDSSCSQSFDPTAKGLLCTTSTVRSLIGVLLPLLIMDPLEQRQSKKTFKLLRRATSSKRPASESVVEIDPEADINSGSAFLQLPVELRMRIYKHVFSQAPVERLRLLHYSSQASSVGGLILTCRQTRKEARQLYCQDAVVSLWPHCRQDAALNKNPIPQSWRQSRDCIALIQNPSSVQQLALLITLSRESKTICENFIEAEVLSNAHSQVKDLYIRLCICGALRWLHETPINVTSFCMALEAFADKFSTLKRIHVLYCGQQWPVWIQALGDVPFPEIALAKHEARMSSGGNWSIRRASAEKRTLPDQGQPTTGLDIEDSEDVCRLRTEMTWNHAAQQAPWKERSVDINYYDSWTVLNERCVRNRPPQQSMFKISITTASLFANRRSRRQNCAKQNNAYHEANGSCTECRESQGVRRTSAASTDMGHS
jgi:hypothetical protein